MKLNFDHSPKKCSKNLAYNPEVILVEVMDYLILRAVVHYHADSLAPLDPNGPSDAEFAKLDVQARYNRAMEYYLAEQCSTGRMAELLQISWADMRERFVRLDIPLFLGSPTTQDVRAEVDTLSKNLPK